jgi:hypothetical protein
MSNQIVVADYISRVERSIENALQAKTKLTETQLLLEGMSSNKNRIFLNELLSYDASNVNYLEIGTWFGSTLISALYKNEVKSAVAIDNFAQFGGNYSKFVTNCLESGVQNFKFLNADCFNLSAEDKSAVKDVNIYFYDGDHTHEDQRKALTYYIDGMKDVFIFIVDDWNHEPAKTGTRQGLIETNLTVHKEWELPANYNGDRENWWNGLYVAVCEKKK